MNAPLAVMSVCFGLFIFDAKRVVSFTAGCHERAFFSRLRHEPRQSRGRSWSTCANGTSLETDGWRARGGRP